MNIDFAAKKSFLSNMRSMVEAGDGIVGSTPKSRDLVRKLNKDLAILGIAEVATLEMLALQIGQGTSIESIKTKVQQSVYWAEFCQLARVGEVMDEIWLPGALGRVVLGWARQEEAEAA